MLSRMDLLEADYVRTLAVLLDAAVKGLLILAITGVMVLVLRRASAALRHLAWSLALSSLLCLPLLSSIMPQWQVPIIPAWAEPTRQTVAPPYELPTVSYPHSGHPLSGRSAVHTDLPVADSAPAAADSPSAKDPWGTTVQRVLSATTRNWPIVAMIAWGLGALALGARLAVGIISVLRTIRHATAPSGDLAELLHHLRAKLGIRRNVELLCSSSVDIPMTWGAARPVIVVPPCVQEWPALRLRAVLVHELVHIKRLDWLTLLLGKLARILYWFHPVVWLAVRAQRAEAERSCDDRVLSCGLKPSEYARQLLDIVATLRPASRSCRMAVPMARTSSLEGRIVSILDPSRQGDPLTWSGILGISALMTAILFSASILQATPGSTLPNAVREGSVPSRQEILRAVQASRSTIKDLSVSFSFDSARPRQNMINKSHVTAVIKDQKVYMDHVFSPDAGGSAEPFHREVAFNGTRATLHTANDKRAMVWTGRDRETALNGVGFFEVMLMDPDSSGTDKLISVLKASSTRVRDRLETVNGHPCVVVDAYEHKARPPLWTVWLDMERGYLPVRAWYKTDPSGHPLIEFTAEEAMEAQPGLWLATKGRKKVDIAQAALPDSVTANEWVLKVDRNKDGETALAVNTGVKDEFFDLWKRLPTGIELWDKDANVTSTVGDSSPVTPMSPQGAPVSMPGLVHKGAPIPDDRWTRFVRQFIATYKLNEAQEEQAWSIHNELKRRAQEYRVSHKAEYEAFSQMDDKARQRQSAAVTALGKPVESMFEELKTRLMTIPTDAQRKAVAASSQPIGPPER